MIIYQENCKVANMFDFSTFAPAGRVVFFDIETTGLKAGNSSLYLIGFVSYEQEGWVLTQYFAEDPSEEKQVLQEFTKFLQSRLKNEDHLIIVSFDGDMFDIPYLKSVASQYHMPDPFRDCVSFDLYKMFRPYKKLTGITNCKLKTIESELCGIHREDPYNGGELIYVYEEYVRMSRMPEGGCEDTPQNHELRKNLLKCLLMHNGEDIKDMLSVMRITAYQSLFDGAFHLQSAKRIDMGESGSVLDLKFRLDQPLPKELYYEQPDLTVSISGEDPCLFELVVPIIEKRLRYFFSNYKEYYYLPAEDEAIHKSLGDFVDRRNRVKATAATCYTWKEGAFFALSGPVPSLSPYFYPAYKGKAYAEFSEGLLANESVLKELALASLEHIRTAKSLPNP